MTRMAARRGGLCAALVCSTACVALWLASARAAGDTHQRVLAYVTLFGGDGVAVVDPAGRQLVAHIKTGAKPHGVAIAPDGSQVVVSNEGDGTLSVIDPRTQSVIATIPVGREPNQVAMSADGRYAFVTLHAEGAVAIVDLREGEVEKKVPVGRTPHIAMLSPDGETIYVTSEGDMKIVALDARTFAPKSEIDLLAFPRVLALTPDGSRLFVTIRWLNGALVVDPKMASVTGRIALGESLYAPEGKDAHCPAVAADGTLWITNQMADTVTVVDTGDHQVLARVAVGDDPNWIGFTPDGAQAVISNTASNDVTIVDVARRSAVGRVEVGSHPKRLAVGSVAG